MPGDQQVSLEDLDLVGQAMDLHHAPARGVGDRVVITRNAHHPLMADPSFKFQNRSEGDQRQALQCRPFFGEGFVDDASGRCMDPRIGDIDKPARQLRVQVIDVAKDGSQEEVFPNVTERSLDLALCFGSIGSASLGQKSHNGPPGHKAPGCRRRGPPHPRQ